MLPSELTYAYVFISLIAWEYKNRQCKTENMKHRIKVSVHASILLYLYIHLYT